MGIRKIIRLYNRGNVQVFGLRGSGKDMLTANVVVRRKLPYISNIDYGGDFHPLNLDLLDCGKNTYEQFLSKQVNFFDWKYDDCTDVYISDCGVYFPSQYCNELNKKYPYFPTFFALCRQIGDCNVHCNSQALNRVWDKIREQGDTYILCRSCHVFFGKIVFQRVTTYDMYESALSKLRPFPFHFFSKRDERPQKDLYECTHGEIHNRILIYINRSNYDTRYFKKMLLGGK